MTHHAQTRLAKSRGGLERLASTLNAISPLNTLARGYSITSDENGRAITDARQLADDASITTRLHRGRLISRIIRRLDD